MSKAMSETPLTDANAAPCAEPGYQDAGCVCVSADFARTLERRNRELESELAGLRGKVLTVLNYPDLREYIGALLYDDLRQAAREGKDAKAD